MLEIRRETREDYGAVEELTRRAVRAVDGFAQPEFHIWLARSLAQRTR